MYRMRHKLGGTTKAETWAQMRRDIFSIYGHEVTGEAVHGGQIDWTTPPDLVDQCALIWESQADLDQDLLEMTYGQRSVGTIWGE